AVALPVTGLAWWVMVTQPDPYLTMALALAMPGLLMPVALATMWVGDRLEGRPSDAGDGDDDQQGSKP
ncbi:MAG: hypothetical protein KKB13_17310, partial [Chloroflexi bacterium]|nr:hypothetical protein [Chloroflexota bacterium]